MPRNRMNFELSATTLRKLILWSASRGEKKNNWARTVLAMQAEENYPKIQAWLAEESSKLGVTPDELENAILTREGFDFDQYRSELLGDGSESIE